jgi:hypothetical protein
METLDYPTYETPHYGKQEDFKKGIRKCESPSALSALESLEASLWLLSGNMASQALFLLHHTIEVAFKGLLEEIDVLLTLDSLEYDLAKGLVWERVRGHRLGKVITKHADPENYDPTRTCRFEEAYRRVNEMITFNSVSNGQVKKLNKMRNAIVHYGGRDQDAFDYLDSILNIALPWLREFYEKGYGLSLDDLVFRPVARELDVARQYINLAKTDTGLPRAEIMHPFQCQFHLNLIVGTGHLLFDPKGWQRDLDDWKGELYTAHRERADEKGWETIGEGAHMPCVICGEDGCIVAISDAFYHGGVETYCAVALDCPSCDLYIDKSYKELARLHYGPITKERLGAAAWETEVPRK